MNTTISLINKKMFGNFAMHLSIVFLLLLSNFSYSQNSWSGWENLGMPQVGILSEIIVVKNADGRLEIFTVGKDSALWHTWQVEKNKSWSSWSSLGSPNGIKLRGTTETNRIAAGVNLNGEIEVFILGNDNSIWGISENGEGGRSGWNSWVNQSISMGDPRKGILSKFSAPTKLILDIAIGKNGRGTLELFIKNGNDKQLWHTWQDVEQSEKAIWTGVWAKLGSPEGKNIGRFVNYLQTTDWCDRTKNITSNPKQDLLTMVNDNGNNIALWHKSQNVSNGGWRSSWESINDFPESNSFGINHQIAVGRNLDGRLEFFTTNKSSYWHTWQTDGCNNTWTNFWHNFGKPRTNYQGTGQIAVEIDNRGCLHLFTLDGDPNWGAPFQPVNNIILWHVYQTAPSNGWGKWQVVTDLPVPNGANQLCTSTNADGRMEVFAVGLPPINRSDIPNQVSVWHIYEKPN